MKEINRGGNGNFQSPEGSIVRDGNVVHISKPEGTYTVVYQIHERFGIPGIPVDPQDLPKNLSGLALDGVEFVRLSLNQRELAQFKRGEIRILYDLKGWFEDEPLLRQKVEQERIPLYALDAAPVEGEKVLLLEASAMAIEAFIAWQLLLKSLPRLKDLQMSRRGFLNMFRMGLAGWLLSPFISTVGTGATLGLGIESGIPFEFNKLVNKVHPEMSPIMLRTRNIVFAEKEEWLMRKMGGRPDFATILGAAHTGVEDAICSSSVDRLSVLRIIKPILQKIYTPENFYTIARLDFDGEFWVLQDVEEVPTLKALMQ